ncbi:MAG: hypothetical protein HUJ65_05275, partial [Oscillospiraceae bacterium]|nr:hypothetical protein [Oscillospiraceae bacterium]
MADIGTGYLSSESMIEPSGYIVHGSVVNITYTYDSGNAIMFYDVLLDEVWWDRAHEGDSALAAGDKITVFQSGGYIPGDVFSEYRGGRPEVPADSLVMQTIMGIPFPENGAEYVLFLQDSPEPKYDGVFMVTGVYQGRYEVKNGTVSRYCPEKRFAPSDVELYTDNGITLDELREHVLEAIENYQPPQIPTLEEILDNFIAKRQSFVDYEKESAEAIGALEEYEDYLKGLQEPIDKLPAFFSRVLKRNDEIASKADSHPSVLLLDSSSPDLTYGGDTY